MEFNNLQTIYWEHEKNHYKSFSGIIKQSDFIESNRSKRKFCAEVHLLLFVANQPEHTQNSILIIYKKRKKSYNWIQS